MILRQFVTGSNAVEEIYIVKSECPTFVNETIENGSEPSCDLQDTAEQCVLTIIEATAVVNRRTDTSVTIANSDTNAVSIVKQCSEQPNEVSSQIQLSSDKNICQLCMVNFDSIAMLKQHLNKDHHHMLPFRCKSCASREIKNVLLLNKHFSQHDRNKLYKCSYCEARFESAMRRSVHQRRFHQEMVSIDSSVGRYTCRYCEKRFVGKANFDRHERNHDKQLALSGEANIFDFLYHCYVCSKQFTSKHALNEHLIVHVDRLPFRCGQCVSTSVIISSVRSLNKHVALHIEKKPIKCIYCAETFITVQECETHERLSHVELHLLPSEHSAAKKEEENESLQGCRSQLNNHNHTSGGTFRYECSFCNKSYSLLSTLRRHENVHTGNKQFICKICGKIFKKSSCLSQHERIHLDDVPYKCSYCGKGFKETIRLIEHRRIHTGEKPFQCDHCSMRFRLKSLLKAHAVKCTIKQIAPAQDVQCEHCELVFPSNCLLIMHAMDSHSQHMSVENKCRYCDMKLKPGKGLLEHELQHREPGVIECKQCGRIFKQRSNLRRHQRLHTMNAMPYKCDMCDKSFSQLSTMNAHRRVHTGEKPYKCELCGKSFQHTSTKNRHVRSHYKPSSKLFLACASDRNAQAV
ncbi:zinc finger protein 345-like [Anopheles funestus]|uniref:zinc finger protein 345-like n=1 Tax=Anopheles funestus TaxID=62324 RepID=UPI0020C5D4F6|nr:zinc finger protein 345-like [Anopheles funestus]